jgi:hypothetical protein
MKVYPSEGFANLGTPLRNARMLSEIAGRYKESIDRGLREGSAKVTDTSLLSAPEVALDFCLVTPLGRVYARFDLLKISGKLAGKYTFSLEGRDNNNLPKVTPVFAFLFNAAGEYQFGQSPASNLPKQGFTQPDQDFAWYLVGNVISAQIEALSELQPGFDLNELLN